eukprot:gene646-1078_t
MVAWLTSDSRLTDLGVSCEPQAEFGVDHPLRQQDVAMVLEAADTLRIYAHAVSSGIEQAAAGDTWYDYAYDYDDDDYDGAGSDADGTYAYWEQVTGMCEWYSGLSDAEKCNTLACAYDSGDCVACQRKGCRVELLLNSRCDGICNNEDCAYDMGSCQEQGLMRVARERETPHPGSLESSNDTNTNSCTPAGCPPGWQGDGWCDPVCFLEACGMDGGDCNSCVSTGCQVELLANGKCDSTCNNRVCHHDASMCEIPEGMDPVTKALQEALTAQMVEVGSTAQLTDVTREYSFAQLCEAVKADPRYWCDGAMDADGSFESDGGAPSTVVRDMLTQAGELVALLQGARGLVLVQLWSLQVSTGALHYPFVLRLLRMICEDPALKMSLSTTATPEGEPVGFSAVVHAAQSPFEEYTKFLAELGVQSALVPDDALSKILIGQALGYKKEHIVSYVQSKGQEVTSEMEEQQTTRQMCAVITEASNTNVDIVVMVAESKTGGFGAKAGKAFGAGKKRKSKGRK